MTINLSKHNTIILSIIICFITLQILCLCIFGYTPYPDSDGYILLAKECVKYNTFYPLNLTDIYFLWNIGAINAITISLYIFDSVTPLLLLYSIMQGLIAWLVYIITQKLFNYKTAFISLCLFICYPANYGVGTSTLSEVPFIFFSLLAIYQSLKGNYLISGICLTTANYFRPLAIIFIVALLTYMYLKKTNLKNFFKLILGFCLISCTIGLTNYIYKGKYFTQGAMGWMGLMQYSWDNDSNKENDYKLFNYKDPNIIENQSIDCLQRDSIWRSHFLIWLSQNKIEYIKQMPKKVIRTYCSDNVNFCVFLQNKQNSPYMYDEISMISLIQEFPLYNGIQIIVIINLLYYYILLFTGIGGSYICIKNKLYKAVAIPATTILIGTLLLMFVGHGEARFHQPFMPLIIMLSAYFINSKQKTR